ncbi:MAG: hypothetical protein HY717_08920 [Planctomycetes bacterium]|nr:hypothetical protein [Planctomycetota bacterium]
MEIEIDPQLVEEAVSLAMRRRPQSSYWQEREALYEIEEPERREAEFNRLNQRFFDDLSLGAPIFQALSEQHLIAQGVQKGRVLRSLARKEEGAELFVNPAPSRGEGETVRSLAIRLAPQSLLDPEVLLPFLRHELFHIADMLDPSFQYDPELPEVEGGSTRVKLILNRYRVLWDTVIDGRLCRRGTAAAKARELRQREFCGEFALLGEKAALEFGRWFECERPSHPELLKFAADPLTAGGHAATGATTFFCPLCQGLGTNALSSGLALPESLASEIRRDAPRWQPVQGLCQQCLDLYKSRPLSRAAADALPKG